MNPASERSRSHKIFPQSSHDGRFSHIEKAPWLFIKSLDNRNGFFPLKKFYFITMPKWSKNIFYSKETRFWEFLGNDSCMWKSTLWLDKKGLWLQNFTHVGKICILGNEGFIWRKWKLVMYEPLYLQCSSRMHIPTPIRSECVFSLMEYFYGIFIIIYHAMREAPLHDVIVEHPHPICCLRSTIIHFIILIWIRKFIF